MPNCVHRIKVKRSALCSMSKISTASFSSTNCYWFGYSLTARFRALLWRHQWVEVGRSSHSLRFTYRTFTAFLSDIYLHSMLQTFTSFLPFPYSLSQILYFSINSVISFSLSHFCTINSITFRNFPQNYSSGFNSASLVTTELKLYVKKTLKQFDHSFLKDKSLKC